MVAENMISYRNFETFLHRISFGAAKRASAWQLVSDLTSAGLDTGRALEAAETIYRQQKQESQATILGQLRRSLGSSDLGLIAGMYTGRAEQMLFGGYGEIPAERLFAAAARILNQQLALRRAVLGAVAGPVLVVGAIGGLYYILGSTLFPTVLELVPEDQWPASTRNIAWASMWYADNIPLVLAMIAITIVSVTLVMRRYTGPGRSRLDRLLPFSIYKLLEGTSFTLLLVEQGRMGVTLNSALLQRMARNASPYSRHRIETIARLMGISALSIGSAAIRAGHGYPSPELNTVLAALSRDSEDWVEQYSSYVDTWAAANQRRARTLAAILNIVLLVAAAGSVGGFMYVLFDLIQLVQSGL